jgi:O-antigen/teichoic acid export membrane protein
MLRRLRVPLLTGILAVIVGMPVFWWAIRLAGPTGGWLVSASVFFALYFIVAGVFGFLWPKPSWAWGVWILLPFALLMLLSVGFSGELKAFAAHDLAPLVAAIMGSLAGGEVGSLARKRSGRPARATGA